MLTIQILIKNNQDTIKNTLESLQNIDCKIIIGDLGSSDKTLDICSGFDLEIIKIHEQDRSKIRNSLTRKGLNFYINPWEELIEGKDLLNSIEECSEIYIFNNDVISKEIRLWTNEKFTNPVFETIINKNAKFCSKIIVSSKNKPNNSHENLELVKKWINNRAIDVEPYYYLACCYLSLQKYDDFIFYAQEYCAREKKINASFVMMKYYMSQIKLYQNKIKESAELALTCLSYHPALAEFWCLLGDIYYKQKIWKKSKCFYENAIILGSQRKHDDLPIEIKKYKEYPEKMINNIEQIQTKTGFFSN